MQVWPEPRGSVALGMDRTEGASQSQQAALLVAQLDSACSANVCRVSMNNCEIQEEAFFASKIGDSGPSLPSPPPSQGSQNQTHGWGISSSLDLENMA